MSRFLSPRFSRLEPYTPGEQPKDRLLLKLNTNESPYPPSPLAQEKAAQALKHLELYPDPQCQALHQAMAEQLGVMPENVLATNGSDEILNFAFMAFCDQDTPAVFCDITYGFYRVFADLYNLPCHQIPLKEDLSVDLDALIATPGTVFLANPNAPTGLALPLSEIRRLVSANPERLVVVDEAYVDFGTDSAVSLTKEYDNLLVTQTFSKSRSMAGARLGFGIGNAQLIADLNAVKYSTNPYNINAMTMAAGLGVLADPEYTRNNCQAIIESRTYTQQGLKALGFEVCDSRTNFVFARHRTLSGQKIYQALRQQGILVRHFSTPRICDYNRITVGTREQMQQLLTALEAIVKE